MFVKFNASIFYKKNTNKQTKKTYSLFSAFFNVNSEEKPPLACCPTKIPFTPLHGPPTQRSMDSAGWIQKHFAPGIALFAPNAIAPRPRPRPALTSRVFYCPLMHKSIRLQKQVYFTLSVPGSQGYFIRIFYTFLFVCLFPWFSVISCGEDGGDTFNVNGVPCPESVLNVLGLSTCLCTWRKFREKS